MLSRIALDQITCLCGKTACLLFYGCYLRWVKTDGDRVRLRIQRVRCSSCKHTHAILPGSIVPYSQIPLEKQISILLAENRSETEQIMEAVPEITECDIHHIRQQFKKHWEQRMHALGLDLSSPAQELAERSLLSFRMQFMQVRNTVNIFFPTNTG